MAGIRDIWLFANNIIRSTRQLINEDLKPLHLGSAEGNILIHLLTHDRGLGQEEIVDQLDISKPAVSRALDSLAKKGYIRREKDPRDKRASRILLTDRAREIGPQVERVYDEVYSIATQVVSPAQVREFVDLFGQVSESYSRARAQRRSQRRPQ